MIQAIVSRKLQCSNDTSHRKVASCNVLNDTSHRKVESYNVLNDTSHRKVESYNVLMMQAIVK